MLLWKHADLFNKGVWKQCRMENILPKQTFLIDRCSLVWRQTPLCCWSKVRVPLTHYCVLFFMYWHWAGAPLPMGFSMHCVLLELKGWGWRGSCKHGGQRRTNCDSCMTLSPSWSVSSVHLNDWIFCFFQRTGGWKSIFLSCSALTSHFSFCCHKNSSWPTCPSVSADITSHCSTAFHPVSMITSEKCSSDRAHLEKRVKKTLLVVF